MKTRWLVLTVAFFAVCLAASCTQSSVRVITLGRGQAVTITSSGEDDPYEREGEIEQGDREFVRDFDEMVAAGIAASDRSNDGEMFRGKARARAKTSLANAMTEKFDSLDGLLDSLPSDAEMISLNIGTKWSASRVEKEYRNVSVQAWLYAASKEEDNDFHLIVGPKPGTHEPRFMNVEISGLPAKGKDKETLARVRLELRQLLSGELPKKKYDYYNGPIPVILEGSLFYDTSHPPGQVGPSKCRPNTAWEIHPLSKIAPVE